MRIRLAGVAIAAWLALGAQGADAAGPGYFSPTGSMSIGRAFPAMAPLPDGRVLVAGGAHSDGGTSVTDLSSAEIFDPATNSFSSTGIGSMTVPRTGAVAAPLPDGRVLVAGGSYYDGSYPGTFFSSAEVFNPETKTFSSAGIGSMSVPRAYAVAAPLPDGRVLVAGGYNDEGNPIGNFLSSAEVFDPDTNTFSSAGIGSMSIPREGAVAAPLPDGQVLVGGGYHDNNGLYNCPLRGAEVFDPSTNAFSSTGVGSMSFGRANGAAAPLGDGSVLVVSGVFVDLHCGVLNYDPTVGRSAEAFDPSTYSFSSAGIGVTSVPRYDAAAAPLPDGRALVAGGEAFDSYSSMSQASAEIFTLCAQTPARCATSPATCHGKQATITGSSGSDRISGTRRADVITGLGGNDRVRGLAGNDIICGGDGDDTLKGGTGKDKLYGEAGKDKLRGGPGRDKLRGGSGRDRQVQ